MKTLEELYAYMNELAESGVEPEQVETRDTLSLPMSLARCCTLPPSFKTTLHWVGFVGAIGKAQANQ